LDNGLEQLARGINLGDTGWLDNTPYTFTFEYSATSLKVSVDGNLEIDITGNFNNGRLAFYNFSQADVKYNNYVVVVVNVGIDIEKLVSGDGGVTFFDANNCNDADVPFTVEDAVYKLIVTNWGQEAVTLDKIVDLDLGINLPLNPTVTIQPNDSVEFTNDAGQTQGLLQKEGACPNPDNQFENMATVSGTGDGSGDPVEATDPACVKCEPPPSGITRTLGYWKNHPTVIDGSFDGPGGFPGLLPLNFCGEYIVEPCDAVAFLSTDGGGINNFKRQGMAALLNCQAFGCPGDIFNLIADGSNACASGDMFDFDTAGFVLDVFNNSGDDLDLPFQSPPAYPKFCE
jgi:hypothetical protein